MSDEMTALSRRAVACKGWRWMGGMLRCSPVLEKAYFKWEPDVMPTERVRDEDPFTDADQRWSNASNAWVQMLPDLADAATIGCLLALVREAWAAPRALVRLSANGKSFHVFDVDRVTTGGNWAAFLCGDHRIQTEAEALVAALESAP